ncbi:membrane protein insertase YidC [Phytohabitans sp. ZYX-F-186]|uniref:Membrane protein insertase YidC n=1 Tax=Phytohabitans maris TaxID=3071409 RepID=A0ABU0ZJ91_9ACTN|nr:membrane protein insertase YidC [Phytohabitans sp. ZYX-F-186]MDQ7907028.1 membrane protein insertase YidC [Phytohabitans sp. ZYX-F-186]
MSLDWIYWAISWILLRWHSLWETIGVPDGTFLGTNWAWILSIIFLVVTVRVILFPIFVRQIKSQRAMQALQPQVKALQEKHKGDRETLQKEMMELYRKEKANPLMGCLPMFLQIPVFLGLFHVLRRLDPVQSLNTTLYGWKHEQWQSAVHAKLFTAPIAAQFGSSTAELEGMGANGTTVKIIAAILVAIMITTTYLTSRQMILKTGWAEDPQQRMIQRLMLYGIPASLLVSGAIFPIGVIIYWVTNNLFTLGQQQWVLRKYPPPVINNKSGKAVPGPSARKATAPKAQEKPSRLSRSKANGAVQDTKPAVDGRALAPKPGAKPVNPKKRKPAKRQG